MNLNYTFNLPPETEVIKRNRTITTYYAQLYQNEPQMYKWAGMAAFASFHIGERLQMFDWQPADVETFVLGEKKSLSLENDFQIIRYINNTIFEEIGWVHLAYSQMNFDSFKTLLIERKRHPLIIGAFEKLHRASELLKIEKPSAATEGLIWQANKEILWHEQSEVVQPLFDQLSEFFSSAMTFFASFDYEINHIKTSYKTRSRFILFMIFRGLWYIRKDGFIPDVTNLEHRWYWISHDLLKKWQKIEAKNILLAKEIEYLAQLEKRNLQL